MVYIPGGSRIGKTRIAFEFCHIDLALVQERPLFQASVQTKPYYHEQLSARRITSLSISTMQIDMIATLTARKMHRCALAFDWPLAVIFKFNF